jgi:hypothetical protein
MQPGSLRLPNFCIIFAGTAYDSLDKKFEPINPSLGEAQEGRRLKPRGQ